PTTAPTQHLRKRQALRERAEIFSLQLSPRLNKRSRSWGSPGSPRRRCGLIRPTSSAEVAAIAPEGQKHCQGLPEKIVLAVVWAQRGVGAFHKLGSGHCEDAFSARPTAGLRRRRAQDSRRRVTFGAPFAKRGLRSLLP